jgi:pyruvate dehydrogenase E1 component alpha subunit
MDNKYATEEEIKVIDKRVKALVEECEKFADESDYPPLSQMYDMVYDQEDYPFLQHKL